MKKIYWILFVIGIVILAVIFVRFFIGGDEDSWIKDSRGVYIKHGSPALTPDNVLAQQDAINCSWGKFAISSWTPDSQCLGVCGNYAVDIVHVPRTAVDDLAENQCEAYRNGEVSHFIELDKDGNVVRIV